MTRDANVKREAFRALRRTIGQNLHGQRRRQKMSLEKCARLSGLPPMTIDFYEMGKGDIPLSVLAKLAYAFNVPPTVLLNEALKKD